MCYHKPFFFSFTIITLKNPRNNLILIKKPIICITVFGQSNFYVCLFVFYFHVKLFCWLTATVEPFFPTPPACIILSVTDSAQTPHTTVITTIEFHSSILPNTLNWLNVWFGFVFEFIKFWVFSLKILNYLVD